MIRLFSLIKSLYVRSGRILLKCVSPLLMGAVLALCFSINVHAYEPGQVIKTVNNPLDFYTSVYTDHVAQGDGGVIPISSFYSNIDTTKSADLDGLTLKYTFKTIRLDIPYDVYVGQWEVLDTVYDIYDILRFSDIQLHLLVNGTEYILYPNYLNTGPIGTYPDRYRSIHFAGEEYIDIYTSVMDRTDASLVYAYVTFDQLNPLDSVAYEVAEKFVNASIGGQIVYDISIAEYGVSDPDLNNSTNNLIHDGNVQAQDRWEEDRSDAESAGSNMTGFASQLDNLKNTWSILWYPIEFTNRFIQVFVGGTQAAAYQDDFAYITGYTYNDETGFLEPIMARSVQPASAGTGITFPAFSLMGYQIWDSYTYDLSQVKDQLPAVFDALYVIISILEMLWFVGYLRKKYEEVFG